MCRLLLGFVFFGIVSCTYFTQAPPDKPTVSWQSTDQPPLFPGCEQEPSNEKQWLCFQKNISNLFKAIFENHSVAITYASKDTIWIHLRIDNFGTVLLDAINESDTSSDLFRILQREVAQFPKMSPPTKTNLGVTTQIRVRLPIRVP